MNKISEKQLNLVGVLLGLIILCVFTPIGHQLKEFLFGKTETAWALNYICDENIVGMPHPTIHRPNLGMHCYLSVKTSDGRIYEPEIAYKDCYFQPYPLGEAVTLVFKDNSVFLVEPPTTLPDQYYESQTR